jgi:HEAT repeat protein
VTHSDPRARQADGDDIASAILNALNQPDRHQRVKVIGAASRAADPDDLVRAVGDHVDHIRRNAAMDALAKGGARSVPALVRALEDPDPEVVMFAAGVLGKTRTREAVPHLVRLLGYEDVNIVQTAAESLGHLRAAIAVEPLVALLADDPWVRYAAIHALGEIGDPRAADPLAEMLADPDAWDSAVAALGKVRSLRAIEHLAAALLSSSDDGAFESPLRALGDALRRHPTPDPLRGLAAWKRLAGADQLRPRLANVLERPTRGPDDVDAAEAAATLIRLLELQPLYGALVAAAREPQLRSSLEFQVLGIGAPVEPALSLGLADASPSVRAFACECAGALRLDALTPRLIDRLADDADDVRARAIQAVAQLRASSAVAALTERLLDPAPAVRAAAQQAITSFDPEDISDALLSVPRREPEVVIAMLRVMRAGPHPNHLPFLVDCLASPEVSIRALAIEALAEQPDVDVIELLEPTFADPSPEIRRAAIAVVGRRRTARASALVLRHLTRPGAEVALLVDALVAIDGAAAAPRLLDAYRAHPDARFLPVLHALARLGEPAAQPCIVALLGHADVEVRRAAVEDLARFDGPVARRHLLAAASDPAWQVRAEVAEALGAHLGDPDVRAEVERLCLDEHPVVATTSRHHLEIVDG